MSFLNSRLSLVLLLKNEGNQKYRMIFRNLHIILDKFKPRLAKSIALVMKNSSKFMRYLAIGVTGLAILGGSYHLVRRSKAKQQKDRVIKILQEIRRDLFPILKVIANKYEDLRDYNGTDDIPAEFKEELSTYSDPPLISLINLRNKQAIPSPKLSKRKL